jgi:hypothetical protein
MAPIEGAIINHNVKVYELEIPYCRIVKFGFRNAEHLARIAFPGALEIWTSQSVCRQVFKVRVVTPCP